ncbi:MAG: hypothetical protein ACPHRA_04145, partial [Limisphaerales bacterium]
MTGASTLAWMTLLLPLASAAVITLGTLKNHRLSANLSIGAILGAFVCSLLLFLSLVSLDKVFGSNRSPISANLRSFIHPSIWFK